MTRREIARRAALWAVVPAFFAVAIWRTIDGQPTGLLGFSLFPVVGAVILTERPGNGVGRLLMAWSAYWIVGSAIESPLVLTNGPPWIEPLTGAFAWLFWGSLPVIGLIFPTGRIETRVGRIAAVVLSVFVVCTAVATATDDVLGYFSARRNPLAVEALGPAGDIVLGPVGIAVFVAAILGILTDLFVRWRRADGIARLQFRWLFFGLSLTMASALGTGLLRLIVGNPPWMDVLGTSLTVVTNAIPVAIGIAITRHGLYEIGRVVSRSVAYALVTAIVVGVYLAVATSVTWLLPGAPTIAVAGATLAAAAVLLPAFHRIRRLLDRRFDRERYDAQRLVDAYGAGLRTEVDDAGVALRTTVDRTLQPAAAGLWTPGAPT